VLLAVANSIDSAMKSGPTADVRRACAEFLDTASDFYKVPTCCSQPGRYEFAKTGHADPDIDADNSAEGDHLFRHIPEHSLPRVLPSSRLSKMQISAFTSELLIDLDRAPQLPDGLRVDAYVLTNGPELASSSRSDSFRCDSESARQMRHGRAE